MSALPPVQVWIVNGQLLTNRPDVFAGAFAMPEAAPVDGLTRVSHRAKEMPKKGLAGADYEGERYRKGGDPQC